MGYPYSAQPVLVSGANIKTIGGESVLGSGDIDIDAVVNAAIDDQRFEAVYTDGFLWVPSQSKSIVPLIGNSPTFTRASSAMVMNASGLWESKSSNQPRFHHRYIGGNLVSAGILLEESRENAITQSVGLNNWDINNLTLAAVTSPDGTNNAWSLTESTDGAATFHRIYRSTAIPAGTVTSSIFFKPAGRTLVRATMGGAGFDHDVTFNTENLRADTTFSTSTTAKVEAYPNGWYRLVLTKAATGGSALIQWWVVSEAGNNYVGDGRLSGYFWAPQLELGSDATTPILTTSTAVTRAADVCKLEGLELSLPCMAIAKASLPLERKGVLLLSVNDATSNNVISVGKNSSGNFEAKVVSGGATEFSQTLTEAFTDFNDVMFGVSCGATTVAAIAGEATTATSSVDLPTRITQLEIGPNSNACISSIRLYNEQTTQERFVRLTGNPTFYAPDELFTDSYSDYAVLTLSSSSAQFTRDYSFGNYEYSAPGARIRFRCTYPELHLLFTTNTPEGSSQNGVASVLVNGTEAGTYNMQASSGDPFVVVVKGSGNRLIEFIMPYSRHVDFLGVKAYGNGTLSAPPLRPTKKIAIFGDSIVQGFNATRSTKTWAYQLCELQNAQLINYGFGSSFIDDSAASVIRAKNPSIVICTTGYNSFNNQTALATYKAEFSAFHAAIRATLPTVPIYLGGPWYTPNTNSLTPANYRTQVANLVTELADANTYYVDTLAASTTNNSSGWPDTVHPNDVASLEIATYMDNLLG